MGSNHLLPNAASSASADKAIVQKIRVVIHTTGIFFESDTRSGNHASIYLVIPGGSVRLNMTKEAAHHTLGTLKITQHVYDNSNSALKYWDLTPVAGLTVGHIVDLLFKNGRDKYQLSRNGTGCRYWVSTLLADIDGSRYVSRNSQPTVKDVRGFLRYNYSKGAIPELEEIEPGKFL